MDSIDGDHSTEENSPDRPIESDENREKPQLKDLGAASAEETAVKESDSTDAPYPADETDNDGSMKALLTSLLTSDSFLYRKVDRAAK